VAQSVVVRAQEGVEGARLSSDLFLRGLVNNEFLKPLLEKLSLLEVRRCLLVQHIKFKHHAGIVMDTPLLEHR